MVWLTLPAPISDVSSKVAGEAAVTVVTPSDVFLLDAEAPVALRGADGRGCPV